MAMTKLQQPHTAGSAIGPAELGPVNFWQVRRLQLHSLTPTGIDCQLTPWRRLKFKGQETARVFGSAFYIQRFPTSPFFFFIAIWFAESSDCNFWVTGFFHRGDLFLVDMLEALS